MDEYLPRIIVFASGEKEPDKGGSGYFELEEQSRTVPSILNAKIVAVVSNHECGGVRTKNKKFNTPFEYFPKPHTAEQYKYLFNKYQADFAMFSGWLPWIKGLDVKKCVNIHPGKLPEFGGTWGHYVHEKALKWFQDGKGGITGVSMHFVDEVAFDHGPQFFFFPVQMRGGDTAEKIGARVNEKERAWQSYMLNLVAHGHIRLEGEPNNWRVVAERKFTGIIPGFTGKYI